MYCFKGGVLSSRLARCFTPPLLSNSSSYWTSGLDFDKEQCIATALTSISEASTMSRRSLRIHSTTGHYGDESLLDSAPSLGFNASYSAGGASRRDAIQAIKSRRTQSLLQTPRKSAQGQAHNSSLHSCAASDASLLSSMLDESCIQERTLVDNFWGLDEEAELQDQTIVLQTNGETSAQTQTSMVNGYFCTVHTDGQGPLTTYPSASSSSKYITSSSTAALARPAISEHAQTTGPASSALSPPPTIYSRDKSRKTKTGVLYAVCSMCLKYSRRAAASTVSVSTVVLQCAVALASAALQVAVLRWSHGAQTRHGTVVDNDAHSSSCGSMNVKELEAEEGHLDLNGPLWKAATGVFRWLRTGWYHLITLMSFLNGFVLTRCLPRLLKLLLLPCLLLVAVWCWGPSSLLSGLPAFSMTEWVPASLSVPRDGHTPRAALFTAPPSEPHQEEGSVSSLHSERLARLEESLSKLWEHVEGGGQRMEQQHGEVMGLYQALQEQLPSQAEGGSLEPWVSRLLEDRLVRLRAEMAEEESAHREQSQQQEVRSSRLDQMELLLQALSLKTEEVQKRQETMTPPSVFAPVSTPSPPLVPVPDIVDRDSHDALLAEVQRLELVLVGIREDLQGVMGCQGRCGQLDSLQDTVSAQVSDQVRQELRSLFYGSQKDPPEDPHSSEPGSGETELPDSLLLWLSERYVSGADLQASLASLELRILQNVSVQLQHDHGSQQGPCTQSLTQTVLQTVGAAGATQVTEEEVQLIVRNALKLYSEDRTGLVDYALESGGGSIMSTRCSETYETKTALMSLFGLPLWYFSQSPRVVIQPDINPGNCWAFRGSSGYLVIRLSMKIRPSAFSMEHIPKALSPTGRISSAPRQFTVYGLDDESQERGKLLGNYTYVEDGDALQTYPVSEVNVDAYQIVEVRVLSNWGHQEYTCLYRVRVHGEPV
ncbi:SUN domain-containing protein 1 isoform X8 [Hypomesus transpacificus]|uniref:SUN domain-containing protein 1 isoform X8 n=1 Tax=Hypomesus transpacificus TaxID=137520 RepID=UPI001F072E49|nr:SUN domain-containing protein 1 isoform X8 [Hypomesus transpacificus]